MKGFRGIFNRFAWKPFNRWNNSGDIVPPFNPSDLNPLVWTDPTSFQFDGGANMIGWNDISGNENHFEYQGEFPSLVRPAINGYDGVNFNSNSYFVNAAPLSSNIQECFILFVFDFVTGGVDTFIANQSSLQNKRVMQISGNSNYRDGGSSNVNGDAMASGSQYILAVRERDDGGGGGEANVYLNGSAGGWGAVSSLEDVGDPMLIGVNQAGSQMTDSVYCEVYILDYNPSDAQTAQLLNWFNSKYNIY